MKTLCLDMGLGISGDMFSAACYSYMDGDLRCDYLVRAGAGCEEFGGSIAMEEVSVPPLSGHAMHVTFADGITPPRSIDEAAWVIGALVRRLGLSEPGKAFTTDVLRDIIGAEAAAHGVTADHVHLHEIGRMAGLYNIASAGLCYDILGLDECEIIGSPVSLGGGRIRTEHGLLDVPTPAAAYLSAKLKTRPGPHEGEMATPTGIAIAKNLLRRQVEPLPEPGRQGIGFGSKSFKGVLGSLRLFECTASTGGR